MTQPLVVVSAGTYHLPFNRLIDWMEPWAQSNPQVRMVVQHGPSRQLAGAENHIALPYAQLLELCEGADAIVLQGGAGGVMDMRQIQRVPIVVPRVPVDNEVVDDHQLLFTQRALELKAIWRATTKKGLWSYLDSALVGELDTRAPASTPTEGTVNIANVLKTLPSPVSWTVRCRRLAKGVPRLLSRR